MTKRRNFPSFIPLLLALILLSPLSSLAAEGITISAVGDVMMGSDYPSRNLPPDRGRWLLTGAAPVFKASDLALANLEGPLLSGGKPAKPAVKGRSYLFRTPPSYAFNLKSAGVSMVSLANNHSMDFGPAGLASTKRALDRAGVAYSSKSGEIAEFTVRGLKVGVLALSFGAPPRSISFPARALREIERLSARYDVLVLSIHAGAEGRGALHTRPGVEIFMNEQRGDLVRFARDAIERGADLVLGHGPHVPRAMELYNGRLIAYSLGNFATYGGMSVARESGYAPLVSAELAPDGSFVQGRVHSFLQRPLTGPRPDPKHRASRLIERLSAQDFPESPLAFGATGEITVRQQD